jgi:hypothetical protein
MIETIINKIREELKSIFVEIDNWFDVEEALLNYVPNDGGWSIRKILEHISLTNHFLLILIRKGTVKSLEKAKTENFSEILTDYDLDWNKLSQIGEHKSFEWNRPEHMEPGGNINMFTVRNKLHLQLSECLEYADQLKNGEGVLYKMMMSVNRLGKIDVYHFIYFLAQHAKRHIVQMGKIKSEFR